MVEPSDQTNIFHLAERFPNVAELCNALYERELRNLANSNIQDPSLLKRKLSGLSHHIKNAAEFLLNEATPIDVDVHNGSWKSKQAGKCPAQKNTPDKNQAWFSEQLYHGAIVAVYINEFGNEHIELDSVDILPTTSNITPKGGDTLEDSSQSAQPTQRRQVHTNKFGWFNFNGQASDTLAPHTQYTLVKPNKAILSAACSGHMWNTKGKALPRALSLRELLLSTNINWHTFK